MARLATSGTQTDGGGSITTNMANLQATLRTIITGNAAWSLVETINGTTNVDVYKCAAAASGLPKDFYVVIFRNVANGSYTFLMGEDYNAATHVLTNTVPSWSGSVRAVDAATGLLSTPATATFNVTTGAVTYVGSPLNPAMSGSASITYTVIMDSDHFVLRIGTYSRYFGAFDSFVTAVSDPMPVGTFHLSGTGGGSSSTSGSTRNPGLSAAGVSQSHTLSDALVAKGNNELYPNIALNDFTVNDPWIGGVAAYEIGAVNNASGNVGTLRGRVKKCRKILSPPTGTAVADTFTIAGRQWQVVGVNGTTSCLIVDPGP